MLSTSEQIQNGEDLKTDLWINSAHTCSGIFPWRYLGVNTPN